MNKTAKKSIRILICIGIILSATCPAFGVPRAGSSIADQTMLYVVQPGDTLWDLAAQRDIDRELLAGINGLDPEARLIKGQVLKIPLGQLITHEVQEGETIWRIARNYHIDYQIIMRENEMTDPRQLMAGQKIAIPIPPERVAISISPMRKVWSFDLWPVNGEVSSMYGMRDGRMHEGLDIAAPEGTPIYCVQEGVVVFAGERGTYGNAVIVDHGDGLRTLYAHASKVLVSEGEVVEKGQVIALVGNTGRSTGPHTHFEVLAGGRPLNPAYYLPVNR